MFPEEPPPAAEFQTLSRLALQPLSTGELLDRVFFLYRARPLLFWTIALVPALISLAGGLTQLADTRGAILPSGSYPRLMIFHSGSMAAFSIVTGLLNLAAISIAQAATTLLVAQMYLGQPANAVQAVREALPRTLRYIGVELWKVWSGLWLPVLLGTLGALLTMTHLRVFGFFLILLACLSVGYGVIAYLRNSLALPASVLEQLLVRPAMRRSKGLTSERKSRIFLMYVVLIVLYLVMGLVALPLTLLFIHTHGPTHVLGLAVINQVVSFLLTLLLLPIAAIALTLFYLDERIRREGFDIDFMVRGVGALTGAVAPSSEPPAGIA